MTNAVAAGPPKDALRAAASRLVTLALTHPLAMRIKRPLRDGVWSWKGRHLRNPAMPAAPRSLLFVCKGNICRSPFASALTELLLRRAGTGGVLCESAGISASADERPPAAACAAAARFGVSLDGRVPILLTRDLVDRFEMIVVMEAAQFYALRAAYPEAGDRIFLLPLLSRRRRPGYARYNIADPFGHPVAVFNACYEHLHDDLGDLLDAAGLIRPRGAR